MQLTSERGPHVPLRKLDERRGCKKSRRGRAQRCLTATGVLAKATDDRRAAQELRPERGKSRLENGRQLEVQARRCGVDRQRVSLARSGTFPIGLASLASAPSPPPPACLSLARRQTAPRSRPLRVNSTRTGMPPDAKPTSHSHTVPQLASAPSTAPSSCARSRPATSPPALAPPADDGHEQDTDDDDEEDDEDDIESLLYLAQVRPLPSSPSTPDRPRLLTSRERPDPGQTLGLLGAPTA